MEMANLRIINADEHMYGTWVKDNRQIIVHVNN